MHGSESLGQFLRKYQIIEGRLQLLGWFYIKVTCNQIIIILCLMFSTLGKQACLYTKVETFFYNQLLN